MEIYEIIAWWFTFHRFECIKLRLFIVMWVFFSRIFRVILFAIIIFHVVWHTWIAIRQKCGRKNIYTSTKLSIKKRILDKCIYTWGMLAQNIVTIKCWGMFCGLFKSHCDHIYCLHKQCLTTRKKNYILAFTFYYRLPKNKHFQNAFNQESFCHTTDK